MGRALDPDVQHVANLKRRLYMLARHERERGPDGKSRLAVRAGKRGGQKTVERHGPGSVWGLAMNLKRHYGIDVPWTVSQRTHHEEEDGYG
jgi:hypothetical protein